MNCIRRETGGSNARYVFIQDKNMEKFSPSAALYADQLDRQLMANVMKGGQWGSYRHLSFDQQKDVPFLQLEHAYINTVTRGDLSSLKWIESPLAYHRPEKSTSTELCNVYYSPLNFRFAFNLFINIVISYRVLYFPSFTETSCWPLENCPPTRSPEIWPGKTASLVWNFPGGTPKAEE